MRRCIGALALDLGLGGFDPLTRDLADRFRGAAPRGSCRASDCMCGAQQGDTVERIEGLALVNWSRADAAPRPHLGRASGRTWTWIDAQTRDPAHRRVRRARDRPHSSPASTVRFVGPGPSGAPTRGRPGCAAHGAQFLLGRCPRRADAGRLERSGQLAADRLVESYWQESRRMAARDRGRGRAPRTRCAPAVTISRRHWR